MAEPQPFPKDDQQGGIHCDPAKPPPYAEVTSAALHVPKQVSILL